MISELGRREGPMSPTLAREPRGAGNTSWLACSRAVNIFYPLFYYEQKAGKYPYIKPTQTLHLSITDTHIPSPLHKQAACGLLGACSSLRKSILEVRKTEIQASAGVGILFVPDRPAPCPLPSCSWTCRWKEPLIRDPGQAMQPRLRGKSARYVAGG